MSYREKRLLEGDIRCYNKEKADIRFHDGGLAHAKGACNYQVIHASANLSLYPEGMGFTYNHAGMLTYFNNMFLVEYLGGPKGEHEAPSAVFVCASTNGIDWGKPQQAFPPIEVDTAFYKGPKKEHLCSNKVPCIVHHRMGFYTSSDNRLLMMTFYGISPDFHTAPNNGYGVGRVVREVYSDLTMSDIYFLRYNVAGGYNNENTDVFPFYEQSSDEGFKNACKELLADKIATQQWWEEERLDTEFFKISGGRALSYYTLPTGRVMGVFKDAMTCFTDDGGNSWSDMKKSTSIETSSGKVWGQKTADGKYALVYNPSTDSAHRWPLAMVTGTNGVDFHNLIAIHPEVSPCRYEGALKNLGPQYVRGITQANAQPRDQALWVVYSVNKEDIWVARVPVPAVSVEENDVCDIMSQISDEALRSTWNLYVPSWNSAVLVPNNEGENELLLTDSDPYDRTRAMRLFKPATKVEINMKIKIKNLVRDCISIFVQDKGGKNIISVVVRANGKVYMHNAGLDTPLCTWEKDAIITINICTDSVENRVMVTGNCKGDENTAKGYAAASVDKIERILLATKYSLPWQGLEVNGRDGSIGNLPYPDKYSDSTAVSIIELITKTIEL